MRSVRGISSFLFSLVKTQSVINRKHLGFAGLAKTTGIAGRLALHGQTNFLRMLWKFPRVYNPARQYADHQREVCYELPVPDHRSMAPKDRQELYIHPRPGPAERTGRAQAASPAATQAKAAGQRGSRRR